MNSIVPWVSGGAGFILLAAGLAINLRSTRGLLAENKICRRQNGILFRVAVDNGFKIPPEYWGEVHEAAETPLPEITERDRKRGYH
jgi:hypothetical protein